jgi:hypothetical protein
MNDICRFLVSSSCLADAVFLSDFLSHLVLCPLTLHSITLHQVGTQFAQHSESQSIYSLHNPVNMWIMVLLVCRVQMLRLCGVHLNHTNQWWMSQQKE